MTTLIRRRQLKDLDGDILHSADVLKKIAGNGTTTIFTGTGILFGIVIWVDVDGGTFYFTDNDDAAITGLPDSSDKAMTRYPGTFRIPHVELDNGLKIVTESAATVLMTVFAAT